MDDHISGLQIKKHSNKAAEEKYHQISKEKLTNAIKQKFDSTIIGSLFLLEKNLGFLWGHGLEISDLTESQLEYRKLWEVMRKELLDAGHSNARAAKSEISNYTISWNRYIMTFKVIKEKE